MFLNILHTTLFYLSHLSSNMATTGQDLAAMTARVHKDWTEKDQPTAVFKAKEMIKECEKSASVGLNYHHFDKPVGIQPGKRARLLAELIIVEIAKLGATASLSYSADDDVLGITVRW